MGHAPTTPWMASYNPPGLQPTGQWALGACPIHLGWAAPFLGGLHMLCWLGPGWGFPLGVASTSKAGANEGRV